MKVAIIGAGLSGLACAYTLEKNGISPVIFERRDAIGQQPAFAALMARVTVRSKGDPLKYIQKKYGLRLMPLSHVGHIVMHSKNNRADVRGSLGYAFKRGRENFSIENQIAARLKSPVIFNTGVTADSIKDDFDHVVVACGNAYEAKKLGVWTDTFVSKTRVSVVSGRFDPYSATIWFNNDCCKNGFAFLIPISTTEATLALITDGLAPEPLDRSWQRFIEAEKIKHPVVRQTDIDGCCGLVSAFQKGNVYLTGDSAGLLDDVLGVGCFNAVESGAFAADAIAHSKNYDRMVRPLAKDIAKLHEIKKLLNKFGDDDYDRLLSAVTVPGIKQLIYRNPLMKLSSAFPVARYFNRH